MARIRRILRLAGALLGVLLYVWVAAVRLLPEAKRRRAATRARWAARRAAR